MPYSSIILNAETAYYNITMIGVCQCWFCQRSRTVTPLNQNLCPSCKLSDISSEIKGEVGVRSITWQLQ